MLVILSSILVPTEAATGVILEEELFLGISQNSQESTCARVSEACNFIKKRLWHRCFPMNFAKFLRTPIYRAPLGDCFCPKSGLSSGLSICRWNLKSLAARNVSKVNLPQAYNSIHTFNIICLSETFLDLSIQLDYPDLLMNDYTLVRDDHRIMSKEEEFTFITKVLTSRVLIISRLNECLILEVKLNGKSVILSTLYRSLSQLTDESDNFLSKPEDNLFYIISN